MISQSAFAAGAGAAEVGAGAVGVGAGVVAAGAGAADEADGQGVDVADAAGTGIVVEVPAEADGPAAPSAVPATAGVAEALPSAPADVAPAAAGEAAGVADVADPAEAGVLQRFARAAALAEASSTVLMCGVMTAAIPTPSTSARSPIISAGRARGGRSSWLRSRRAALR
jgi:hypothetical protein